MSNFSQFYQDGGVFMHAVSIAAVAAVTVLSLDMRARERGDDARERLGLVERLVALALGLGAAGSALGSINFGAALTTIEDPALVTRAFGAGLRIVPIPLAWALMVGVPIWLAASIQRHRAAPIVARAQQPR